MNDFDENISKKDYIDIQIGLWKHFHEYVDSLETKQQKIISIIATVITALLAISIWQNILLVYYCVPVVLLLLFNYHSSVARSIAILNGYISFLEKEINSNFSKPTFIWSSKYAGKFLINNIPQTMSKVLAIFLSLGACVFIAMQIIKLEFYLLIAIIFIVFLLIALFVTIVGYLLNDKTKTNSLNFALQLYLNTQDDNELAKDDTSKIMNIYSNSVSINHSKRIPFFIATSVSMISVIISIVVFFTKNDIKLVLMNLNWVSILGGLIGVIGTFIVSLVFNKALKKSTGKPKIELNKV
jgi:hypothetical protein